MDKHGFECGLFVISANRQDLRNRNEWGVGMLSVNNAANGIEYEDCKADMDFESNTIELDQ
ncbi:hypothetical protein FOCG_08348 [Fusarium oxysporum f. sp. radicis-lycopersici 26381]|uniref:Uncharacterized protein n=1 Tax=Fusarium oxysporum Fo47 TaxID=660027 RepID=W9JGT9_FUSOX|nr:hypothetical protein FOZG_15640 [Fusarium oxysporum Fo47]EXL52557.1 hypothetical protein FOCG_08348 [Fusarium oxysporum f. sp. radicis-lycopersici 26381]